jgi:hypothetical protein
VEPIKKRMRDGDKDFHVWNAAGEFHRVMLALKQNMIVCTAKIALPYKERYQFFQDIRSNKVAVAAQSKDHIDNDLRRTLTL